MSTYRLDIQLPADIQDLRLHSKLEIDGRLVRIVDPDEAGGRSDDRPAAVLIIVGDHVDAELVSVIRGTWTAPVRISELPGHAWLERTLENEMWRVAHFLHLSHFSSKVGIVLPSR